MFFRLLLASIFTAVASVGGHPHVRGGDIWNYRRLDPILLPQCGENDCWCDVTGTEYEECPLYPFESVYLTKTAVSHFFASLTLDNPDYEDIQMCNPDLSSSVNTGNVGLTDANVLVTTGILDGSEPPCDAETTTTSSSDDEDGQVCGIELFFDGSKIYPDDFDDDCTSSELATSYKVRTFENNHEREEYGYFPLHYGACGTCSTTQDLASYMKTSITDGDPTLATLGFLCYQAVNVTDPPAAQLVAGVSYCLQHGLTFPPNLPMPPIPPAGLSENCAKTWAMNVYLDGLDMNDGGCLQICSQMLDLLLSNKCYPDISNCPYNPATCELHECLRCDNSVAGGLFSQVAAMTRRNSGIHTFLPRKCGELATDIIHTCVAKD